MDKDIVEVANQDDFDNCKITPETPDQTTTSNISDSNTSKTQVVGIVANATQTPKFYISTDQAKCKAGLKVQIIWQIL